MTAAGLGCATCGTALRENAKFCDECGSPLSAPPNAAEFKQVTVLFADVVGSMRVAAATRDEIVEIFAQFAAGHRAWPPSLIWAAKRSARCWRTLALATLILIAAEVDWPVSPSDLRARRLAPKRPRPHQREAISAVVKGFDRADRGQMIMACGTGKMLAALFIREKLVADRTQVRSAMRH